MKEHLKPFIAMVITFIFATNAVFALEIPERFGTGPAPYVVVFNEAPVALYKGGIDGFNATNPSVNGKTRLNPKSDDVRAYVDYLKRSQQMRVERISQSLSREVQPLFEMQHALNAAVLELTHAEAMSIQNLEGIRFIEPHREYKLDNVVSDGPFWIGADGLWDGSEAPNGIPVQGEGMVLGIIDSGVNSLHLSVAATDPVDGYVHTNPLGSENFLGVCDPKNVDQFDPTFTCNDKLIGAYDFLNTIPNALPPGEEDPGSPEDENSHGTHVGTTAGGNRNNSLGLQVQGVAPRSNIIAYDACYTNDQGQGRCPFVSTAASINQAIADGIVDAINYSIGGGNSPWTETSSLAFLSAVESGIFVATSGGNSGPGPSTTGHIEPWTLSVAAATDNAIVIQEQTVSVTGPGTVPANLQDMDAAEGSSPIRIPSGGLSGDLAVFPANLLGCDPFPANTFDNQIALIQRGDCAFALKSENAANAGADAMLLDNNTASPPLIRMAGMENATIPSVSITQADGVLLRNWLDSNPDDTTIFISDVNAFEQATDPDVIVNFSSRGPSPLGNLKPEIAAPGSNVFAPISVCGIL